MRVSLVIAAHNEGEKLWKTIESCAQSCGTLDYEVVVSDDATDDGSVEEALKRFPRARVVRTEERQGASPAKASGAAAARGDTLIFLDSHTKPETGAIERLVSSVELLSGRAIITPRIAALCPRTWRIKPDQIGSGYYLKLDTFDCGWLPDGQMKPSHKKGRDFFESPALIGCALAVSRELYDQLGGFDPHMRMWGVEDLDFGLRCWLLGFRILHDPAAVVGHRFQSKFDNYSAPRENLVANQLRMARKNFTHSVWAGWVEQCRQRTTGELPEHPEGLWARAWQIFEADRPSVEAEQSHVQMLRTRDEFWYATRFGLAWPSLATPESSTTRPPRLRPDSTLVSPDDVLAEPSPSPPPIAVKIFRNGVDITNTTTTVIVGQKISLEGKVTPGGLEQTQFWEIPHPSTRIKGYTQAQAEAKVAKFRTTDFQHTTITFYWIAGGSGIHVNYDVKIDDVIHRATATFNVLRPTAAFTAVGTAENPPIYVGDIPVFPPVNPPVVGLTCGSPASPALTWTGTVTAPAGGAGLIATTQLIDTVRSVTHGDGKVTGISSKGKDVSDDLPNKEVEGGWVNGDTDQNIAASATQTCGTGDQPAEPVAAGDLKVSADDSFKNFLMYKPEGDGNIWVTLSVIEWSWGGTAAWDAASKKWNVSRSVPPAKALTGPTPRTYRSGRIISPI